MAIFHIYKELQTDNPSWRHDMETFSVLLFCFYQWNAPVKVYQSTMPVNLVMRMETTFLIYAHTTTTKHYSIHDFLNGK